MISFSLFCSFKLFFSLYIGLIFRCPFSETFRAISILIPPSNFQKRWVIQSPNHPTRCRWCRRWVKKPLVRRLNFVGNLRLPEIQLMVNCWFGILGIPLSYSNNAFHKEILGIQTTNPSQQLSISLEMQSQERQFETWSSVEYTWIQLDCTCQHHAVFVIFIPLNYIYNVIRFLWGSFLCCSEAWTFFICLSFFRARRHFKVGSLFCGGMIRGIDGADSTLSITNEHDLYFILYPSNWSPQWMVDFSWFSYHLGNLQRPFPPVGHLKRYSLVRDS